MNKSKKEARLRRAKRSRCHIVKMQERDPELARLVVYRSSKNIAAQVITVDPYSKLSSTVVAASTYEADVKQQCKYTGNVDAASVVGKLIAERVKAANLPLKLAFDRSGFKYHGRIKALADAAREGGLEF